jgi:hypothetical protein
MGWCYYRINNTIISIFFCKSNLGFLYNETLTPLNVSIY